MHPPVQSAGNLKATAASPWPPLLVRPVRWPTRDGIAVALQPSSQRTNLYQLRIDTTIWIFSPIAKETSVQRFTLQPHLGLVSGIWPSTTSRWKMWATIVAHRRLGEHRAESKALVIL